MNYPWPYVIVFLLIFIFRNSRDARIKCWQLHFFANHLFVTFVRIIGYAPYLHFEKKKKKNLSCHVQIRCLWPDIHMRRRSGWWRRYKREGRQPSINIFMCERLSAVFVEMQTGILSQNMMFSEPWASVFCAWCDQTKSAALSQDIVENVALRVLTKIYEKANLL